VFEDDIAVHLVMELCEGGSVLDGLRDGEYSERQVAHIMRAVVRFIAQCHAKGLIYRDIKPDNFLLVSKATPRSPLQRFGDALGLGSPGQQVCAATEGGTVFCRHRCVSGQQCPDVLTSLSRAKLFLTWLAAGRSSSIPAPPSPPCSALFSPCLLPPLSLLHPRLPLSYPPSFWLCARTWTLP
jgi:serine/threonine protein kinase